MKIRKSQWFKNGDHPDDYAKSVLGLENGIIVSFSPAHQKEHDWEGQIVRRFRHPEISGALVCPACGLIMHEHGWINGRNNQYIECVVCPGDWIVDCNNGFHFPVKIH